MGSKVEKLPGVIGLDLKNNRSTANLTILNILMASSGDINGSLKGLTAIGAQDAL